MNSRISLVKCNSYAPDLVCASVRKSIDLLGGITAFVKPQSRVLVKPNLLMAQEPQMGVTTHPEVVRAVIRILKDINCKIFVGDSPSVWGRQIEIAHQVYERCGIKRVCAEEGAELVEFSKRRIRKYFPLTTWLDDCEYFINLPKFKTHGLTILTGAIKNLFGLVCGTYKTELHKRYFNPERFSAMLVDIYQEARPTLNIIDGIIAMEGDGPGTSGKLRSANLILAGDDGVSLDSIMAVIMGIKPQEVVTTREAAKRGLGVSDIHAIEILGDKLEDAVGRPFLVPVTQRRIQSIAAPLIRLAAGQIKYYPYTDDHKCTRCGACIQVCPAKVISMKKNRITFDYRGCIRCFCCQETCPSSAINIKKSILAKMIGL